MHIPNSMLQGAICPVTAVLSVVGVAIAALKAFWAEHKPSASKFGAITALIFAGQMINFPVTNGTSGHLIGGVLAVGLLGLPFGVLSMALVVTVQCLVFSDGGFSVLGANILNMAVIGAGLGGALHLYLSRNVSRNSGKYKISLGVSAWFAVILAAAACSIELSASGTIALSKVFTSMIGIHALIGLGEGLITVAACHVLASENVASSSRKSVALPLIASGVIALIVSPFASVLPDGLEWVAVKYNFLKESAPSFVSPLADYSVMGIKSDAISTGLAGISGVVITFMLAFIIAKAVEKTEKLKSI